MHGYWANTLVGAGEWGGDVGQSDERHRAGLVQTCAWDPTPVATGYLSSLI
jgi:hypothetical protein